LVITLGVLLLLLIIPLVSAESLSEQVGSSADDAHENGGGSFDSAVVLVEIYSRTDPEHSAYSAGGFRFENIDIPCLSSIDNARLELYLDSPGDPNFVICAEDNDNGANFVDRPYIRDENLRVRTAENVAWVENSIGNDWENSPDISAVIEEVICRPGWVENNAIVILCIPNTDQTLGIDVRAYDHTPLLLAYVKIFMVQIIVALFSSIFAASLTIATAFPWVNCILIVTAIYTVLHTYRAVNK